MPRNAMAHKNKFFLMSEFIIFLYLLIPYLSDSYSMVNIFTTLS